MRQENISDSGSGPSRLSRPSRTLNQICLTLVSLLGLAVMAGWWLRLASLVQVLPGAVAMQFNTALCFLLCGVGTLGMEHGKALAARIAGAGVLLIAGLTLIQYLTGASFGVDELFFRHWLTTRTTHPGRMASATAMAFLLYSWVLLVGNRDRVSVGLALVSSLLCAQVLLLGGASLAGYLTGAEFPYAWVRITRMAVHTTLGFLVLGLGGLDVVLGHIRANQPRRVWLRPFWIGQAFCLAGVLFWHVGKTDEARERLGTMRTVLSTMRHEVELTMDIRQDALNRLIHRGKVFHSQPELWEGVASDLLHDFPAMEGIHLLDARGGVLSAVGRGEAEETPSADPDALGPEFRVAGRPREGRYVLGRRLPPGGPEADRLLVVVDLAKVFGGVTEFNLRRYALVVYDGDRRVYPADPDPALQREGFERVEETMPFYGRNLTLQLRPLASDVVVASLGRRELELAMSFTLATLAMLLAYQMRIHRDRARLAEELNQRLEREVEARRTAEARLKEFNRKLRESNEDLESFAYVASHDLQEPLRKIRTFGDRLVERCGDDLNERGRDYLARMVGASGRMSQLIDDLLAYSRVNTRVQPMREIDLNRVVREVLIALQMQIDETGAEIEVGELPVIRGDPSQMRQLFQNLIGNALKFRKDEVIPHIHILYETTEIGDDQAYRIRVRDHGIGIDPEHHEKIFNTFIRLHGRTEFPGSGIGLSICKKIVERHGGVIQVESAPGEGTVFIVTLPMNGTLSEN